MSNEAVWVFQGSEARFPSAVFTTREKAERWIEEVGASGILTRYPVDVSVFDWAVAQGHFAPKKPEHSQARFVERFTSASMDHYHYDDGSRR